MQHFDASFRPEEPPLRRASDQTPLGRLRGRIEYSFGTGDYVATAALIEQDPIAAWFGFETSELTEMIVAMAHANVPLGLFSRSVLSMVTPRSAEVLQRGQQPLLPGDSQRLQSMEAMLSVMTLRLEGRPVEALQRISEVSDHFGVLQPVFDSIGGWGIFYSVQSGLTAMLAGDFRRAISFFVQARAHVFVPQLAFLTRDALVRHALIEATYGDRQRAQALLAEAEEIPRTESWAESTIDASRDIAAALCLGEDPKAMLQALEQVSARDAGEMWPFHMLAFHRAYVALGMVDESFRHLERNRSVPWNRVVGQGYSGSVFELAGALTALRRGDIDLARADVRHADRELAVTRVVEGVLELSAGRPREALELVAGLHSETRDLRMLDLWRLAVTAGSYLASGSDSDALDVLRYVLEMVGELTESEVLFFPLEVRQFAEAQLDNWPVTANSSDQLGLFPAQNAALTVRELDVLRELATGLSREEIAKSQFISLNTLKAHLRSAYRKLGVNTRAAAIIEAERRGLI